MKKRNYFTTFWIFILSCGLILLSQTGTRACTGLQLQTEDGTFVSGRTLEFGIFFETSVIVVPRGYSFTGQTTLGGGKKWKAKYPKTTSEN
jgi:choloylglycine hydrolase